MFLEDNLTAYKRLLQKKGPFFSHPLAYLLPPINHGPSISLACCHVFSFALLVQGAPRCQITTRQPVIFNLSEASSHTHTHTPFYSWPYSLPSPASIQRCSNSRPPSAPTCSLPPLVPSSFYLHKSYLKHTVKKLN